METMGTKKVDFQDAPAAYQAAVREQSPSAVGADVSVRTDKDGYQFWSCGSRDGFPLLVVAP